MMELSAAALFLFSTLYGPSTDGTAPKLTLTPVEVAQVGIHDRPVTLETYVREYFKDTPVLAEIAKCESRFRHVLNSGAVIRGEVTPDDIGVMQVNEYFHEKAAKVLGLNLHTLDGNLAYAKWLYTKEGTKPWFSSSKCWHASPTLAQASDVLAQAH
jgi:hypothetical protein